MRDTHGVMPGSSWGTLPKGPGAPSQRRWRELDCDSNLPQPDHQEKRSTARGGAEGGRGEDEEDDCLAGWIAREPLLLRLSGARLPTVTVRLGPSTDSTYRRSLAATPRPLRWPTV